MIKNQISLLNLVAVLFIVFLASPKVYSENNAVDQKWYRKAVTYINVYEVMINKTVKNPKANVLEDVILLQTIKKELINSPAPTEYELKELLSSPDNLNKKVALVNISSRGIYSQELFDSVMAVNNTREMYLNKLFSYQALAALQIDNFKEIENDLMETVRWEADKSLVITIMPILVKLDPEKALPYFLNIMRISPKGLKKVAALYMIRMGSEHLEKAKEILEKEKNVEALQIIRNLEAGESR